MNSPYFTDTADDALEGFAPSPQQASQWRWQQACGPDAVPMAALSLRIEGPVDPARLRASFNDLTVRHEILRTRYRQLAGMELPLQVIADATTSDIQGEGDDGHPDVRLSPQDDGAMRVQVRLPAFQADAASMGQLAYDWMLLYRDGAIETEALQYVDYAAWRAEVIGETQDSHPLAERPAGLRTPQTLPLRRGVSLQASIEHASIPCAFADGIVRRWHAYAAATARPASLVLLAAWVSLCQQHAAAERLVMGIDIQDRQGASAGAIGLYGEVLPLTLEGLDDLDFDGLCNTLERQWTQLTQWRDRYAAGDDRRPFDLGFRHVAPVSSDLAAAGWQVKGVCASAAPFQILLETSCAGLCFHYNRLAYDSAAIAIISDQLGTILDDACAHPGRPLRELRACSAAEQVALTSELCNSAPLSEDQLRRYDDIDGLDSLAACFGRQLSACADLPAVQGPAGVVSYRELDERSMVLARHLIARGVSVGARVAQLLPRDIDAVVTMLAILRAGACYVPVDPSYPAQRAQFILDDCQAQVIVTISSLAATLPASLRQRALLVDALPAAAPALELPQVSASGLAYLIYTSGSTGTPKAVQITHGNALHSLAARVAVYPEPVGKFLLLSSFAFDSSIAGLFWTLAQGGTLVIATEEEQRDPARLVRIIENDGITHLLALPSVHGLLLEQSGAAPIALSTVIVAGEACPPALVSAHLRTWPHAHLYNEYGPTEASVWSSVAACSGDQAPVPIGRAIPFSQVYVLDATGVPAARGMLGEVYIGGPGLSPGYAGRPELTAEKFVTLAHPLLADRRLYRSGDIAYLQQDGALVFAGRADAQVKIRGHRIEPGDIEAALREVCDSAQAVVVADTSAGAPKLRAFIETYSQVDLASVRASLALRLPPYMIPADISVLPSLPRGANGKIDNKALLALRTSHQRPPFVAPATPAECALATLWQELLGCESPGRDDDFFALGGHSLLAVRLVHLIQTSMNCEVLVGTVFRYPTLGALAAQLSQPQASDCLLRLKRAVNGGPTLFVLHRPAGDVQHYQQLVGALPAGAGAYGLVLPGATGPSQATLAQLAQRYADRMRSVQPEGPYYLCGWSMGGLLALEIASVLEARGERVALLAVIDSRLDPADEGLSAEELVTAVSAELTPASQDALLRMPDALDALRGLDANMGKLAQFKAAFETWAPAYGLETGADGALLAATLTAMEHARAWVAPHTPSQVEADLHLWWASQTLERQPALPAQWRTLSNGHTHHVTVTADHDDILQRPDFIASFIATLAHLLEAEREVAA